MTGVAFLLGFPYVYILDYNIDADPDLFYSSSRHGRDQYLFRFAKGIRIYSAIIAGVGLLGTMLVKEKLEVVQKYKKKIKNINAAEILKNGNF